MSFRKKQAHKWEPIKYEENPYSIKAGKKIYWREFTQAANQDCEVYPTLAKYGMLPETIFDNKAFDGDIEAYGDLRTSLDRQVAIENMWLSMPLEMRRKYGHNKNAFLDDLPNLYKQITEKQEAEAKAQQEQTTQTTGE